MNILIAGAKRANLKKEYIDRLESMPTYKPSQDTLEARKLLPDPSTLPAMTVEEVKLLNDVDPENFAVTSILGYVFKMEKSLISFNSHKGKDITNRQLRHFNGISADDSEAGKADHGQPPYANL
jgi:hypothetical protein